MDKEKQNNLVSLTSKSGYDQNLYGDDLGDKESFVSSKFVKSISVLEEDEEDETAGGTHPSTKRMTSQVQEETDLELLRRYQDQNTSGIDHRTIGEKQDAYHRQAQNMQLSPERGDMFSENNEGRSYADVLKQHQLEKEKNEVIRQGEEIIKQQNIDSLKRQRSTMEENNKSWDSEEKPNVTEAQTPVNSSWDATPVQENKKRKISRWDTPLSSSDSMTIGDTPSRKTRWDETPMNGSGPLSLTIDLTPLLATDGSKALNMPITAEMASRVRYEHEIQARNRPLTDEELETLFPPGYKIIKPPENYKATYNPSKSLLVTPTPGGSTPSFFMQTPNSTISNLEIGGSIAQNTGVLEAELPPLKPEDVNFFGKLFTEGDESKMTADEARERKILTLLLKIKNGTPQQRKGALRQISDKARELGPEHIFMNMLPILKSQTLEEQERHLLVKTLDRVLYKLDDLVRPYAHKILVVIEPLLIDEDYYARTEGKEIISNLAKAAGLATMVSIMRPDIDKDDEFVRNVTSRAFAVVASALGVPTLLPFLKAVCTSKKSWQARQTGIRIVQHIAINMGCAVLPHLKDLVLIVEPGLNDEQQRVRTMSALSLSALAEASYPYGIEAFDPVLQPLWKNCRKLRGKSLAAILKAIGFIIPLMAPEYASHYTKDVTPILIREFQTPDEEMKKTVLKVIQQCVSTDGVTAAYCKEYILPEYFSNFWVRRMALDRRNYTQCVETTIELANKVGVGNILVRLVENLKDESEPFRKMVLETVHKIVLRKGVSDLDANLESKLMDGFFFCFQEQSGEDSETMLNAFGAIATALGVRMKAYIVQINSIIKWRFQNKIAKVRMLAADMITKIAAVYTKCDEEKSLLFLSNIMYENLGEEYPEVLGSILGALKSIVNVVGMQNMRPPIKDLLPKLTPILRNRHEKVQENCIDLVGRIADRGADQVSPREWMRICFDLLEVIKAHKKSIRRAANNTFGYIAKAIGPQDVLQALLANLKVQERQLRLCTTIAIAIIAETCQPFTVLPALMNEYRQPDHNVQNGVLKTLSFMFEYIAEMCQDYIYAITPLLEDALIDRDIIHRQTASSAVGYLAVGVFGLGKEDALVHLLNQVFPNLFETSPHVIKAVFFAMESIRLSIGVGRFLAYVYQGLFHAARKVREPYWKLYNNCYVYCADSMTPYYPRFSDEVGMENYERSYLELNI